MVFGGSSRSTNILRDEVLTGNSEKKGRGTVEGIRREEKEINRSLHLPATVILFTATRLSCSVADGSKVLSPLIWWQDKKLFREPLRPGANWRKLSLCPDVLFYSFFCH